MNTTLFLASLIGPVLLAIGVGILVSRNYYRKIYRTLEQETLAVYLGGVITLVAGIVMVSIHNVWFTVPQMIVSLIAWGTLIKGAILLIIPRWADTWGNRVAGKKLFPYASGAALLLGAYLSYFAYFANMG